MERKPKQNGDKGNVDPPKESEVVSLEHRLYLQGGEGVDKTHRRLKNRHIQFIGIGGAIGTALFVQIGQPLTKGGPGSLFLAFVFWSTFIFAINNCLAEMVIWIPISSPFIRYADRFVDPALGFSAGVNFFALQAVLVAFEITAFNIVLQFWTNKIPPVAVILFVLMAYALLNMVAVRWYGESEFWLAIGKVTLALGLMIFTFITMVGGNPLHDKFGFRNWYPSKVPGAPFAEYLKKGSLGTFLGFLACLIQASFTISGPDYISMAAGEAQFPRKNMPRAFFGMFYRLTTFFILGSLCVGITVPYSDLNLRNAISHAHPGAGASPYVISMERLHIRVLPHIFNALVLTSIFSAGNSYAYCASRTLLGLALEGKAPRFLTRCTSKGVPIYCVGVTLGIGLLALLQISNNSAIVFQWFINLSTASLLLNYVIVSFTYLRFYWALKAQGIPRDSLPHKAFWQPFCGYYALVGTLTMTFVQGYTVFLPGRWDLPTFFFSYAMIAVIPALFIVWKIVHKTHWRKLQEVTFFEDERMEIDDYEAYSSRNASSDL